MGKRNGEGAAPMMAAIGIIVLVVSMWLVLWVGRSKFEADAFNRATGKNVSVWDAMWIELRVQEGAK